MKRNCINTFYRLLHPKVATLIVSIDRDGKANIMAAAWTTPLSIKPALVGVAISPKRYTHSLIQESKEFTVNIPSKNLVEKVHLCGTRSGRDADKIAIAKLNLKPAKHIKTPIVDECIGNIECKLWGIMPTGDHTLFIGEVLAAYVDEKLFTDSWSENAEVLIHVGGEVYTSPGKPFIKI